MDKSDNKTNITNKADLQKATFAAGCFWGVEDKFMKTKGVVETTVGYTGGLYENPTYQAVCSGKTGHAEAAEVTYDPAVVTYIKLLETFWSLHNPTNPGNREPDPTYQYRSAIFYHNEEQRETAFSTKEKLQESGIFKYPIVTQIKPATIFYRAEEYHQQYYKKNRLESCSI